MSSPICARSSLLSARTTARAPSPSMTTPKRTRFGGEGGGGGGATTWTVGDGGGGGGGGWRVGENRGLSSVADSWSNGCAATGLESAAGDGCFSSATAVVASEARPDTSRTEKTAAAGDLMTSLFAKKRAGSKSSATTDPRRRGPHLRPRAGSSARPRTHTAFQSQVDIAPLAVPSNSSLASPEAESCPAHRPVSRLLPRTTPDWRSDRWLTAPNMTAAARLRDPESMHQGMRWVAQQWPVGSKSSEIWPLVAKASRAVRKLRLRRRRAPEAAAQQRTRIMRAAEREPRRKPPVHGRASASSILSDFDSGFDMRLDGESKESAVRPSSGRGNEMH